MTRTFSLAAKVTVGCAVFATACSGPHQALDAQTQAVPVDLVLGHAAVVEAPLAPVTIPVAPVGQNVFPSPKPTTPTAPPVPVKQGPCPAFDPLQPIAAMPTVPRRAPKVAQYVYRTKITSKTSGKPATYTGPSHWRVSKPSKPGALGSYTFNVITRIPKLKETKTTTYLVLPKALSAGGEQIPPSNIGGNPQGLLPTPLPAIAAPLMPGIYLAGVKQTGVAAFLPATPVALVQFPITPGATFTSVGSDGEHVITFTSTVLSTTKVNACGTPVGAWGVKLTQGLVSSPSAPLVNFTETLRFSTLAGGLVVGDDYQSSSALPGLGAATFDETDTINTEPKAVG
ncbi:MAG TPA: hypothetical protein VHC43_06245 [Mycobacteriales bacterium]|nr:hypothetical protein [Mycobacteriales bacterium]